MARTLRKKWNKAYREVTKQMLFIESQTYDYDTPCICSHGNKCGGTIPDEEKIYLVQEADLNELKRLQDIVTALEKREDQIEIQVTKFAEYRWIITQDLIKDPDAKEGTNANAVGVQGPYNCDVTLKTNPTTFSLYDDDGICYAEGMLYGEYSGLEPLDEYGEGNWGCVSIKVGGEFIN